jgi:excisionase family DNA binding protein
MNETVEIQRLTKAIANLAAVLIETTATRVREQQPIAAPPVPQYVPRAIDNLMTKKDVAAYLKVSLGTVGTLIRNHRLPYIKIGRSVRFMISDVENELKRRCRIGGL